MHTGSLRQSREVYGDSTAVYVSIYGQSMAVYKKSMAVLCSLLVYRKSMGSLGKSTEIYGSLGR